MRLSTAGIVGTELPASYTTVYLCVHHCGDCNKLVK